ncbi:MAG: hypothetical protein ABIP78_11855 [Pyrinomonadaceae bacterium]
MKRLLFLAFLVFYVSGMIYAQLRPVEKTASPVPTNLPASFEARYEGGIFGNSRKEKGNLRFDDANERVVFNGQDQKEMFSIPYSALLVIYPDSKTSVSQTGNVVSRLPLPGAGLAGLLSKSSKYLIVRYDDQDVEAEGTANFKFDDRNLLLTFINTLGSKAKMKQKGDAYYRAKKPVF